LRSPYAVLLIDEDEEHKETGIPVSAARSGHGPMFAPLFLYFFTGFVVIRTAWLLSPPGRLCRQLPGDCGPDAFLSTPKRSRAQAQWSMPVAVHRKRATRRVAAQRGALPGRPDALGAL